MKKCLILIMVFCVHCLSIMFPVAIFSQDASLKEPCTLPETSVNTLEARYELVRCDQPDRIDRRLDRPCWGSQKLQLRYSLENKSNQRIHVLKWGTPLEGFNSDLLEVKRNGTQVRYTGSLVSRIGPFFPSDYVTLEPKGHGTLRDDMVPALMKHENPAAHIVTTTLDLAQGYDVAEPGDYEIRHRDVILRFSYDPLLNILLPAVPVSRPPVKFRQLDRRRILTPSIPFSPLAPLATTMPGLVAMSSSLFRLQPVQLRSYSLTGLTGYSLTVFNEPALDASIAEPKDKANISTAYSDALALAASAKVLLTGTTQEEISRGAERYKAYFGSVDPGTYEYVSSVFGTIYSYGFIEKPVTLDPTKHDPRVTFFKKEGAEGSSCVQGSTVAYVDARELYGGRKRIYLCPPFWNPRPEWKLPVDFQAGVVLHEMSHLAKSARFNPSGVMESYVTDHAYDEHDCLCMGLLKPDWDRNNADSYHLFAMNRLSLPMGLDRYHVSLKTRDGKYLRAKDGNGRNIDCSHGESSMTMFALANSKDKKMKVEQSAGITLNETVFPVYPADGDQVSLIAANRQSIVTVQPAAGATDPAGGTETNLLKLRKIGGGPINNGDEIAFQLSNRNSYLSVSSSCSIQEKPFVSSGSSAEPQVPSDAEKFIVNMEKQRRYLTQFRASSGTSHDAFISVNNSGSVDVSKPTDQNCVACTFILIPTDSNKDSLMSGDAAFLMSYNGINFVTVPDVTGNAVRADAVTTGANRIFSIEKLVSGGSGVLVPAPDEEKKVQTGDIVRLRAGDKYLLSENGKISARAIDGAMDDPKKLFVIELAR
jgi:hypothetical protein